MRNKGTKNRDLDCPSSSSPVDTRHSARIRHKPAAPLYGCTRWSRYLCQLPRNTGWQQRYCHGGSNKLHPRRHSGPDDGTYTFDRRISACGASRKQQHPGRYIGGRFRSLCISVSRAWRNAIVRSYNGVHSVPLFHGGNYVLEFLLDSTGNKCWQRRRVCHWRNQRHQLLQLLYYSCPRFSDSLGNPIYAVV